MGKLSSEGDGRVMGASQGKGILKRWRSTASHVLLLLSLAREWLIPWLENVSIS